MKIIKRSGSEVTFDISKIMDAVSKANMEVVHSERLSEEQIETISNNVESICKEMNRSLSVEEIQDLVENQIMNFRAFSVARSFSFNSESSINFFLKQDSITPFLICSQSVRNETFLPLRLATPGVVELAISNLSSCDKVLYAWKACSTVG
jgi:hypothetical protein